MDYMDCANMLYKIAQGPSTVTMVPPDENKKPNYAAGGAGLGAAMGAASALKKGMGPKKELNPNFIKGIAKSHPEYDVVGQKMRKRKLGARLGELGGNISKTPGKLGGSLLKRTAVGAGLGLAAGSLLNGAVESAPQDKLASTIWDFVTSDRDIENLKKGEIEKILEEAKERQENSFLDDIDCEVCGYKGKPTNKGVCPKCGAVLGKKEEYVPAIKPYIPYDGYPMNGVTVYEQAAIDDMETQAEETTTLSEKLAMARAWKANFSEGIRKQLVDSGLLNYEKELHGLDIGSHNIANKIGIPITQKAPEQAGEDALNNLWKHPLSKKMLLAQDVHRRQAKEMIGTMARDSNGYMTTAAGANPFINEGRGVTFFTQHPVYSEGLGPKSVKNIHKMSDLDKRYGHALFMRHEVDEASGARNAVKKGRSITGEGDAIPSTNLATGHISPTIPFRESANVATAPPRLKRMMKDLRKWNQDAYILKHYGNIYGSSGKLDVAGMNRAEKALHQYQGPLFQEMIDE